RRCRSSMPAVRRVIRIIRAYRMRISLNHSNGEPPEPSDSRVEFRRHAATAIQPQSFELAGFQQFGQLIGEPDIDGPVVVCRCLGHMRWSFTGHMESVSMQHSFTILQLYCIHVTIA